MTTRRETFSIELPEMERMWLLQEQERKKRIPRRICLLFVITIVVSGLITAVVKTAPTIHRHRHQPLPMPANYSDALEKALRFFEAQKSGKLPDHHVPWRGDSCLHDETAETNLVGGYYDAGDAVKSSFSTAFSMTLMSWSLIEYGGSKYRVAGELDHMTELIRWGTDYLLKTFKIKAGATSTMVLQIKSAIPGGLLNDSNCWMRPEDIDFKRSAALCFSCCSHVAAETAAALASASIVFRNEANYSQDLIHGAKVIYRFAESMKSTHQGSDELIWAATWLYYATGEAGYLDRATRRVLADRGSPSYVFSWDNKLLGAQLLLTRLRLFIGPGYPYEEGLRALHNQANLAMCSYLPDFSTFNRSKGGLIQFGDPKPLQYAANAAFLASLYSDYLDEAGIPGWYCDNTFYKTQELREVSLSQIDYILGKNPRNMSYLVGFGDRFPKHVHHRGASIPRNQKPSCTGGLRWRDSKQDDPNTIVGAMVAGPDKHDRFQDVRRLSNYTEPSLVGNAGLVAALLAVSSSGGVDRNGIFYAVPPFYPVSPPPPAPWTP